MYLRKRGGNQGAGSSLSRAVALHDLAVQGDKDATEEAFYLLRREHRANPHNQVIKAYYGSAMALMGRDADDTSERFAKALEGIRVIDDAVAADPSNPRIRVLRAHVNYNLPETFFHRTSVAIEDFHYLIKAYRRGLPGVSHSLYLDTLYRLGKAYMNVGDEDKAEQTWQQLLEEKPGNKYLQLLRAEGVNVNPFDLGSQADERRRQILAKGVALHDAAEAGDRLAANEAYMVFRQAAQEYPGDAVFGAYMASSDSLVGKYSPNSAVMFASAINALEVLDKLVKKAPQDIAVRMIRAGHSYRLPEPFFHRTASAIADYESLLDEYPHNQDRINQAQHAMMLFRLGDCYHRLGMSDEAARTWRRLLLQYPDTQYRQCVESKLGADSQSDATPAGTSATPGSHIAEAMHWLRLGAAGNIAATAKAHAIFEQAAKADPTDMRAEAGLGSCIALAGRASTDPATIFGSVVQALMLINRALAQAPDDPFIRFLRGILCYNLPESMFHLTATAKADLAAVCEYLATADNSDPYRFFTLITPDERAMVQHALAECTQRLPSSQQDG